MKEENKNELSRISYLVDSIQEGIIVLNKELRIVEANAWIYSHVATRDEVINSHCYKVCQQLVTPCDDCPVIETFNSSKSQKKIIKNPFNSESSSDIYEITTYPIFDANGDVDLVIESYKDITHLKFLEAELLESQEKYKALYDNAPLAYQSLDIDGFLVDVNPTWLKVLGYNRDEVIGKWFGDFLHPDYVPHFRKNFPIFKKQGCIKDVQFKMLRKNDTFIYVSFEGCIGYNSDGTFKQTYCTFKDITEQKKAEKQSKINRNKLERLFLVAPTGIGQVKDRIIVDVNNKVVEMTGYNPEELIGKSALILYPSKEEFDYVGKEKYDQIAKNGTGTVETCWKTKAGEIIDVLLSSTPIEEGDISKGTIFTALDITESKKYERQLKFKNDEYLALNEELKQANVELYQAHKEKEEGEARFKALHNASFGGITIHDDGVILDCNKGLSEITGYSYQELIGMDGLQLISEKKREFVMSQINSHNEKPYETIGLRKNGQEYPIRLEAREIPYKGKQVRVVEFRDITQQKEYEQEIISSKRMAEENEAKFRSYIDNAPDAVFVANEKGQYIELNDAACEITGYNKTELMNMSIPDLVYPEDQNVAAEHFQTVMEKGTANGVFRFKTKANEVKHWSVDAVKLTKTKFLGFAKDITNKIKSEQELIEAKYKAEESNRLKTEFLNNMSHEIRTPMNGIIGFSEMLDDKDLSYEKRLYYSRIVQNSGHQLLRIIDDILEISTLETKQIELKEEEFSLNDLLMELFSVFNLKSKERNVPIYLKKGLQDNQSYIISDKTKIHKILSNLLENALKFTNEGFIELGYYRKKNELVLYVKDTGIGISPQNRQVIFERFSQEHKEISQKHGGLGLGLSISKENAQLLKGDITLESEKGKGTTFFVTIPFKPGNEVTLNSIEERVETESTYTILVAEDEEMNYLYIEALLNLQNEHNFILVHARNGKEAVDLCETNKNISLILMDIKMPVMGGHEATRLIKSKFQQIPIIAQTAYTAESDKELAFNSGCDDYISKPIKKELFFELINKYIS